MNDEQLQTLLQGILQQGIRQQIQNNRDGMRDLIRQTNVCDGEDTQAVRMWVHEIELAYNQIGDVNIVQVVTNSISGTLRFEIERFIENHMQIHNVTRATVPWQAIRAHVIAQFLNIDELQSLRDECEQARQGQFDSVPQYSRKFREIAEAACPIGTRTADQHVTLVRAFAKGLASDAIARKLIQDVLPRDLEAAITAVAVMNERLDAYTRLGRPDHRNEEATEVGGVEKKIERLSTKLAKIESSVQNAQPHGPIDNKNATNRMNHDSRQPGQHAYQANVNTRRRSNTRQAAPNGPPPRQHNGAHQRDTRFCTHCRQVGHFEARCPHLPMHSQRQYEFQPQYYTSRSRYSAQPQYATQSQYATRSQYAGQPPHYGTRSRDIVCYNCNHVGHIARECPQTKQLN